MQKQSIYSTLVYGAAISIFGKFVGVGLQFLGQMLLARYLGPTDYGLYSIGWSFFQILGVIATFGLDYTVIKFGAEFWPDQLLYLKNFVKRINLLAVLVSISLATVVFLSSDFVLNLIGKNEYSSIFKLFAIGIPFFVISKLNSATSRISQKMAYSVISDEIVRRGILFVFFIIVIQIGLGVNETILFTNLSFVIAAIVSSIFVYNLFIINVSGTKSTENNKEILKYTLFVMGSSFTSSMLIWFDRILLGLLDTSYKVGLYQAASQIALVFPTILLGVNMVVAPMIAAAYQRNDNKELENIYQYSTKWIVFLGLPLMLVIFIYPKFILTGIFSAEYSDGYLLLIIMALTQAINLGTGAVAQVMLLTRFEKRWLWYTLFSAIANIIANSLLIPKYGAIGAAIGSGIAMSGLNLFGLFTVKKKLNIFPLNRQILKGFGAGAITLILLLFGNLIEMPSNAFSVILLILFAYFCFLLCIIILGLDQDDQEFLAEIKNRFITSRNNT